MLPLYDRNSVSRTAWVTRGLIATSGDDHRHADDEQDRDGDEAEGVAGSPR